METMINLSDLLKHEILDLYSVEQQIIEALPKMVEKAKNPELKKALREHLKVTEEQKARLDKVKQTFGEGDGQGENKGFFSRLFGGGSGGEKCIGMEGIISEGEKIMKADITDEALDAAIIASAQKVEHYEICGYGTARAYARELKLAEVEQLLTQTLNEEYAADDKLTSLAVGKLNIEAEMADGMGNDNSRSSSSNGSGATNGSKKTAVEKKSSSTDGNNSSKAGNRSNGNSAKSNSSKDNISKSAGAKASAFNGNSTSSAGSSSKNGSSSGNTSSANKGGSKSSSKGSSGMSKSSGGSSAKNGSSKSATKRGSAGSSNTKRATSGGQRQR